MKVPVTTLDNKKAGDITLNADVFGVAIRRDLIARVVNWQLAKRRAGTHKVKSRGEIARTGAKAFRQKGTGRARRGNLRTNIMRGGGVVHGPVVRSHEIDLPKKVRALALKSALSAKLAEGKLAIVKSAEVKSHKTKELAKSLEALGWTNALIIDGDQLDESFSRAARNLKTVDTLPQQGANVYDILRRDVLVLTESAVQALEERLK
jgi:large subunit ribosomal protein L4